MSTLTVEDTGLAPDDPKLAERVAAIHRDWGFPPLTERLPPLTRSLTVIAGGGGDTRKAVGPATADRD